MENNLYLDPETRDLVIGTDGNLALAEGPEVYAQAVRNVLSAFKGEWFLDVGHGADYPQLLGEYPDNLIIEDVISEAVYQVEQVSAIDNIEAEIEGRMLRIRVEARLKSGEQISVEVEQHG